MFDPVSCADGHSYEHASIARWLRDHDTSPVTGAALPNTRLTPNHALRNSIEEWQRDHFRLATRAQITIASNSHAAPPRRSSKAHCEERRVRYSRCTRAARARRRRRRSSRLGGIPGSCATSGSALRAPNTCSSPSSRNSAHSAPSLRSTRRTLGHKMTMLQQTCGGMAALSEAGIVHRDLASRNVLVFTFNGADPASTVVKVTDFGLAVNRHYQPVEQVRMEQVRQLLRTLGLARYDGAFEAAGYDDADFLRQLSADEVALVAQTVGMKPGHAHKLVSRLNRTALHLQTAERHNTVAARHQAQLCSDQLMRGRWARHFSDRTQEAHWHTNPSRADGCALLNAASSARGLRGRWLLLVGDSKGRFMFASLLALLNGTAAPLGWPTHRVDSGACMAHVLPNNSQGLPPTFGYYTPGCELRWKGPCYDDVRGRSTEVCVLDYVTRHRTRLTFVWHSFNDHSHVAAMRRRVDVLLSAAGRPPPPPEPLPRPPLPFLSGSSLSLLQAA